MPRGLVQRGAMRSRNGDAAGRGSSAQYGSVATALRVADGWWLPVVCAALPRPLPPSPGSPRRVFLRVSCVVYHRGSRTTGSEWDGFSEESVFMAARGEGQVQPPGQEAGGTRRASSSATEPVRACGELRSRAPRDAPAGPREGLAQPSRWLWARPRFLRAGRRLSGGRAGCGTGT